MTPMNITVSRIVDFGTIVSLVGSDVETGKAVTIHVDHRPFQDFWEAWQASGFEMPITFDAESLTLSLNFDVEGV